MASQAIANAKHDLRRELAAAGYSEEQVATLSKIVARFTARVVRAEIAMRDAARSAMMQSADRPLSELFRGIGL